MAEQKRVVLPLLESFADWLRGPARLDGDLIKLDVRQSERYSAASDGDLVPGLTRVKDAESAWRFVERFGLLSHGPIYCEDEFAHGTPRDQVPVEVGEPVAEILNAAKRVRLVTLALCSFRRATDGDQHAVRVLRALAKREFPPDERSLLGMFGDQPAEWQQHLGRLEQQRKGWSDADLLEHVQLWIAARLSDDLAGTRLCVLGGFPRLPRGTFRFGLMQATSLLHHVSFQLAQTAVGSRPVEQCEACTGFFVVEDRRQRFCSKTCATRLRVRRYKAKAKGRQVATKAKGMRARRGAQSGR